ncbi:polar amino acid transport system permease protein [Rhizobium sp. BK196]|jgi:polar amino acid transport system permease protein|uniref:ectoine/hydroxyectoine ABC transporter permease subunit EhuC n=1 Tax=unclassified Rhizobium TaxID=2613769 RepID=UPI00161A4F8F|nr:MULTISPECIES: ectoine/hydroxyectoine ABC transporter permease subunit EhuC [unclassified Rhizobium]MBB3309692.1 polar amino acid transport system permease protein [Rhizobium sp. BK196]MBB3462958.1 polar amino acid transport system permease protein [Rhizobium sp. BK377]
MHWTDYLGPLMEGAWITIELTVYSTILGGLFSFLFGIGKLSGNWFIRGFSIVYIEVFRGTSLLVQLFWLYFALPIAGDMVGLDLRLPPVAAGVLALALNIGAYGAEVVRGAIEAVSRNQYEAATALNFTSRQALFRVALPQAVPEMMPSFSNLAVQNLKDTALVSLVSLADLAFKAEQLRNFYQDSTTIYTIILFMYFGMALVLSLAMRMLENALGRWRGVRR